MATYCTASDVRENTQNEAIAALNDNTLNNLIELAEIYIDAFAGFWQKYDPTTTQTRLFPRQQDVNVSGNTFIPSPVKYATIAQVEFIYLKTPDADHGIQTDEAPTVATISPRAKELMRGYVRRSGRILINSDQNFNPDRADYL